MKKTSKVVVTTKYAKRPVPGRLLTSVVLPTPEAVIAAYAPPPPRRKI